MQINFYGNTFFLKLTEFIPKPDSKGLARKN